MRKIYYGLGLLLCMFLSAACSDNDEPRYQELSKLYIGKDLSLTLNETPVTSKSVKFQTSDLVKGDVELTNLIPGESFLKVVNLTMQQDGSDKKLYHLSGESVTPERTITVKGTVGDGMKLDVTYKATSPVVNKWTLTPQSCITINIVPSSPDAKANMFGISFAKEVDVTNAKGTGFDKKLSNLLTLVMNMMVKLQVDLEETGDFGLHWAPVSGDLFEAGQTPTGLLRYNLQPDLLYLAVDVAQVLPGLITGDMLEGMEGDINIEEILALIQPLNQGLPVGTQVGDNTLSLVLPKQVLLPYFKLLLPMLQGILAEAELPPLVAILGITNERLVSLVGEIVRVMEESPQFDIVISLQPIPAPSN